MRSLGGRDLVVLFDNAVLLVALIRWRHKEFACIFAEQESSITTILVPMLASKSVVLIVATAAVIWHYANLLRRSV